MPPHLPREEHALDPDSSCPDSVVFGQQANVNAGGSVNVTGVVGTNGNLVVTAGNDMSLGSPIENVVLHTALGCAVSAAEGTGCASGAIGGAASALIAPVLVNQAGGLGNLTEQQRAIIVAVSTFAGGVAAGALGQNVAGGANAATDEALYNSTDEMDIAHPEKQHLLGFGEGGNGVGGGGGANDNSALGEIFSEAGSAIGEALGNVGTKIGDGVSRLGSVFSDFTTKYLSGSGGRWGRASTRQLNYDVGQALEAEGYTVAEGGGVGSEEYIQGAGPGTKGGTYVDITAKSADGAEVKLRVQTVTTQSTE